MSNRLLYPSITPVIPCSWTEVKQIKVLLQGPQYAAPLEDKVQNVQKQLRVMQALVEKLTRRTILSIESSSKEQGVQVTHLDAKASEIKEDTNASLVALQQIEGGVDRLEKGVEAQNGMLSMLIDTHQRAECETVSDSEMLDLALDFGIPLPC